MTDTIPEVSDKHSTRWETCDDATLLRIAHRELEARRQQEKFLADMNEPSDEPPRLRNERQLLGALLSPHRDVQLRAWKATDDGGVGWPKFQDCGHLKIGEQIWAGWRQAGERPTYEELVTTANALGEGGAEARAALATLDIEQDFTQAEIKGVVDYLFEDDAARKEAKLDEGRDEPTQDDRERLADSALPHYIDGAVEALREGLRRLKSGWRLLDDALEGGFVVPSFNVLGAKPKCGKSLFAQLVVEQYLNRGGYAYVLDLENGEKRFTWRLLCRRAKLGPAQLKEGLQRDAWPKPEDGTRYAAAEAELRGQYGARLYLDTDRRATPEKLRGRLLALRELAGAAPILWVVDSLQKLPMDLSDRRAGIDWWLRELEALRQDPALPGLVILLITELKRPAQGKQYEATEVAFKESGDIEYTADLALALDRPSENRDEIDATSEEPEDDPATLRILYNRDGRHGRVADYQTVRPYYGMEESPAAAPPKKAKKGTTATEPTASWTDPEE